MTRSLVMRIEGGAAIGQGVGIRSMGARIGRLGRTPAPGQDTTVCMVLALQ